MSKQLNKAIVERINGVESLTGEAATAQTTIASLLATVSSRPAVKYGMLASSAVFPCITFREDAGIPSINADDIGIIRQVPYRFEIWQSSRSGSLIPEIAEQLEFLFDTTRRAPSITLTDSHLVFDSRLFVGLQAPFHDEKLDAFVGFVSFLFVEARP